MKKIYKIFLLQKQIIPFDSLLSATSFVWEFDIQVPNKTALRANNRGFLFKIKLLIFHERGLLRIASSFTVCQMRLETKTFLNKI